MGVLADERPWFGQRALRGVWRGKDEDAHHDRESLGFDLADAMEQGLASEVSTRFETPQSDTEVREMSVWHSDDGRVFHLLGQNGQPVLIAQCAQSNCKKDRSFDIFVASDGDPPVLLGPAFKLTHDPSSTSWELTSSCCSACEYRSSQTRHCRAEAARRLLTISQERVAVGPGFVMSISVGLPAQGETTCKRCRASAGGNSGGSSPRSEASDVSALSLTTRLPKWSSRLRSLTLEFKGRCDEASEKNFQLTTHLEGGGSHSDVVLQYGKMKTGDFCLDFRGPLGPVQAFATALTSAHWR